MKHIPIILMLSAVLLSCGNEQKETEAEDLNQNTYSWEYGDGLIEKESANGEASSEDYVEEMEASEQDEIAYSTDAETGNFGTSNVTAYHDASFTSTESQNETVKQEKGFEYAEKIIRTARIGMELEDYHKGKADILRKAAQFEAVVTNENEQSDYSRISNTMELKVPSASFDQFIQALGEDEGSFDYKRIHTQDVGEEYYDLKTRIKTKKVMEERYMSFLHKAKNIKELLKIEYEIRKLREEIEAKEGRLKFLSNRVSFSTIHLNIYQNLDFDQPVKNRSGFGNKMLKALRSGWTSVLKVIIVLTYGWPYLLLFGAIAVVLYRKLFRNIKLSGKATAK